MLDWDFETTDNFTSLSDMIRIYDMSCGVQFFVF